MVLAPYFRGHLDRQMVDDDDDDDDDDDEGLGRWVGWLLWFLVPLSRVVEAAHSTGETYCIMIWCAKDVNKTKNSCTSNLKTNVASIFLLASSRLIIQGYHQMHALFVRNAQVAGQNFHPCQSQGLSACFGNCTVLVAVFHPRPQPRPLWMKRRAMEW